MLPPNGETVSQGGADLNRADLELFEALPVPLFLMRDEAVTHANRAALELVSSPIEELVGRAVSELVGRYFREADVPFLAALNEARVAGRAPAPVWLRFRGADGSERDFRSLTVPIPGRPGEWVTLFLDAASEALAARLTEALAIAASNFLRCRDEDSVLADAMQALAGEGFRVAILLRDGDSFRLGPHQLDGGLRSQVEGLAGLPLERIPLRPSEIPALAELVGGARESIFLQDAMVSLERLGDAAPLGQSLLASRKLFAMRLSVEERVLGVLLVQGDALNPAAAATLSLFGRNVAAALENVRHHKLAAQRLKELTQLQDELLAQERLAVLGEAAGVVAHEVRNPLGAIINAVALLKRGNGKAGSETLLRMIEEEATRIDDLVRDLLDLARPLEPHLRPMELAPVVQRAVELVRHGVEGAAVEVKALRDERVHADPQLVQMAVESLLRNALQVTPPGSRISIRIEGDGCTGAIVVDDEGPGISEEEAERIFEPFFTTHQGGKGLGLAVVKRVAQAHGGSIEARRRDGGGTTFELRLPRAPA